MSKSILIGWRQRARCAVSDLGPTSPAKCPDARQKSGSMYAKGVAMLRGKAWNGAQIAGRIAWRLSLRKWSAVC